MYAFCQPLHHGQNMIQYISTPKNHQLKLVRKTREEKYKARHYRVGKVIDWELCKFYHIDKWFMEKPKPDLENKTSNSLRF